MISRFAKLLPAFGLLIVALQLGYWLPNHWRRTDAASAKLDVITYYRVADKLREGGGIYGETRTVRDGYASFLYPPPAAALIAQLARRGPAVFQMIWYSLILIAFWVYAGGLARLAFERPGWREILTSGTLLFLTPGTVMTMSFGNIDMIVWAAVAWGIGGGGAGLVVGSALKVYPAFPLAVLLVRRPRVAPAALGLGAAILAATLLLVGWRPFRDFAGVGLPLLTTGSFHERNLSLSTAVLRLVALGGGLNLDAPSLDPWAVAFLRLAPLGAVVFVSWRTRRWSLPASLVAVVLTGVWTAPVCWWYQLPLGLLALAVWWRRRTVGARAVAAATPSSGG